MAVINCTRNSVGLGINAIHIYFKAFKLSLKNIKIPFYVAVKKRVHLRYVKLQNALFPTRSTESILKLA